MQSEAGITGEDYKEARRILRCLFLGVDPANHTRLSDECVVMQPEVKVALQLGVEGLQKAEWILKRRSPVLHQKASSSRTKRQELRKENASTVDRAGQGWTASEEHRLREGLEQGLCLDHLSLSHGRSEGGILERMVRIGYVSSREAARQHFQGSRR